MIIQNVLRFFEFFGVQKQKRFCAMYADTVVRPQNEQVNARTTA